MHQINFNVISSFFFSFISHTGPSHGFRILRIIGITKLNYRNNQLKTKYLNLAKIAKIRIYHIFEVKIFQIYLKSKIRQSESSFAWHILNVNTVSRFFSDLFLNITLEPLEHRIQNASKFDVVFLTSVYPCKYASCKTHILQIVAFAGGGVVLMLKFTCKKHTFYFCSDFFEASFRCFFPA